MTIALAAALGVASPASAAPDKAAGTLTIENVGSSPVLSWSWGISNPPTTGSGSGGAGAGKVNLQDFSLLKRINPLSTELFQAVATGQHFTKAVISVPIGGPGSPFAIEYTLRTVFVSSLQQSGSADQSTESVTLAYGAVQQTIDNTSQFGWANNAG
jgi:type VI secretion system secreted protein Hcp